MRGWEVDQNAAELAATNLHLRGVSLAEKPIRLGDGLNYSRDEVRYDVVISNLAPRGMGPAKRTTDYWANTPSRHFNYLHRCSTLLRDEGRAAVIVPDRVLFIGGQYGGEIARRQLLELFDVHTLLRLPLGIFPGLGVKASVLFFDKKPIHGRPGTKKLWVYDMGQNLGFQIRDRRVSFEDFRDFVMCYSALDKAARIESESFGSFTYKELVERESVNLDLSSYHPPQS